MPRQYNKKSDYWNQPRKQVIDALASAPQISQAAFDSEPGFDNSPHYSAVASCGGGDVGITKNRDSGTGTLLDTNAFRNLRSGIVPFEDVDGYYSVSTSIDLANRAYFNVAIVRNAINTMVDFSMSDIHVEGADKVVKKFIRAWLKSANIKALMKQWFLEYYRSGNVFIYKFDGKIEKGEYEAFRSLDVLEETTAGRKEFASPKIPIRFILLNPSQVYLQRGAMASNGYVKMLSTYEIFRLKNPKTDEDKQILASLPKPIQEAIKKGSAFRYVYLPLEQDRLFPSFFRKQDYEPLAIPMIFPVLNDIEWKLELKKMDMSLSRTMEQVILLVTTGRAADQFNQASSAKNQAALQSIFKNQTVGRVLVADYTTKAEWIIPDLKEILGSAKYERVDKDIREGLQYIFFGDEKFANASMKIQMLVQGLEEGRRCFLDDFLNPQITEICKQMKFKTSARAYLEKVKMDNDTVMKKLYLQMAQTGFLTPAELNQAMETGILPSNYDSLRNQEAWKKQRDDGLYRPMLGGADNQQEGQDGKSGKKPAKKSVNPAGRPTGKSDGPMNKTRVGPIGTSKGSDDSVPYRFGALAVAENTVKMNSFRDLVGSELSKKFGVKRLNDAQLSVATTMASNIILSNPSEFLDVSNKPKWKEAIASCIDNPINLDDTTNSGLNEIAALFSVDSWIASILYRSRIEGVEEDKTA